MIMKKIFLHYRRTTWVLATIGLLFVLAVSADLAPVSDLPQSSAELGERLFMDPILSKDFTVSCSSCHQPEFAFADTMTFSMGINGVPTGRNTPTATYMNNHHVFFWDGRAQSLEEQASGPITHPHEMGLPLPEAIDRLTKHTDYRNAFLRIYHRPPDSMLLVKAIADFERTLAPYDSPYDRFLAGEDEALSESAKRGMLLFFKEQTCNNDPCHSGPDMGADSLVSLGIFSPTDRGLFELTKDSADIGKFKSVHLRNIAITAPYMHDGSKKTLHEVVRFYNTPANFTHENVHYDARTVTFQMTDQQVDDLVAFMESLTDQRYLHLLERPSQREGPEPSAD